MTCEVSGEPKPSVTWSKDGNTSIPRAQFSNDDHILVIQEALPGDGGVFECKASNTFGESRAATTLIIAGRSVICCSMTANSVQLFCEKKINVVKFRTHDPPDNG